jgi:hypothetical protein
VAFQPSTKENFEELFRRGVPESYWKPLEEERDGFGFDIVAAYARMFERVSNAMNNSQQKFFLRRHSIQTGPEASNPVKASGIVTISRLAPAGWDLLIPSGTLINAAIDSSYGTTMRMAQYQTTDDLTLSAGELSGDVGVECLDATPLGNAPVGWLSEFEESGDASIPVITTADGAVPTVIQQVAGDTFLQTFLGRYVRLSSPSWADTISDRNTLTPRRISQIKTSGTAVVGVDFDPPVPVADQGKRLLCEVEELATLGVSVTNAAEITGGQSDDLGAIGHDRGVYRSIGETEEQYRDRIQLLPDVVSPGAIRRICQRVLAGSGINYQLLETRLWSGLGGFLFDYSFYDTGSITNEPGLDLQGQVFVSRGAYRRFFLIAVSEPPPPEGGFFYDITTLPALSPNFYDADWSVTLSNAYDDGNRTNVEYEQLIGKLWDEIDQARAAGVGFAIVQDPNL